ncbi:MAG: hypothetical protein ACRCYU_08740 [Nocardioides sp.]
MILTEYQPDGLGRARADRRIGRIGPGMTGTGMIIPTACQTC